MTRALDKAVRRAVLLVALAGCVENGGGPGRFGEVRVEPAYRAGYEPDAIGVAIDSANVVVLRRGTTQRLVDRRVAYTGGSLAWVLDLEADEESLDVEVELWSGGARRYAGDTAVVVQSGAVASDEPHALAMAYVGPAIVKTVSVTPATDTLRAPGATRQFTAEARDPDGNVVSGAVFAWATTDATVATVDAATGLATAIANGSTTISAASGSVTASATLAVRLPPVVTVVIVTPSSSALSALGATQQFTAEARDASNNVLPGVTFTWGTSAAAVATVSGAGLATATGHGSTTITATSGSVSGSATLDVSLSASIATIVVTPASATLAALGATQQFTAEAHDANGHVLPGVTFTWSSSATIVATVSASGLATATGHGSTTITATSGAVSGSATLDVSLAASVATVVVTPANATLAALGATQQFTAEAHDANGHVLPGVTFSWGSSVSAVATVSASGLATATGHGSTTITATSGSVSGSATLDVSLTASVATIVVTPANATLAALGATQQFIAVARDAGNNVLPGVTFTWSSSVTAVATVSGAGLATATGHGSTTITATSGSVSGSATLDVSLAASVVTIVVTPANATLAALGATQQFVAEAHDANGHLLPGVTFTWSSPVTAVATVSGAGLATATGHGSTTITATTGSVSGSATLDVSLAASVATIVVTPASASLTALGATQQFTAEARDAGNNVLPGVTFTWATSAAAVATVSTSGLATATGHGSTTITATSGSVSGSATLDVSLTASVASVIVTPPTATLTAIGATQQFIAEARDAGNNVLPGVTFTWSSSVTAVATVSASGLATATGHGSTTITATSGAVSGSATLDVSLAASVATIVVTPANATLAALGATQQFTAEAHDANGHVLPGVTFTWSSSATIVATVSASGLATATGHGSTTITATTGSVSGSATLDVSLAASVATIVVTPANANLAALGSTQQFTAEARDAGNNVLPGVTFTWSSSAATVATVSGAGLATATGHGSTTITATTGSVSGSATLDVNLAASVATIVVTPANATLAALGTTQQFAAEARDASNNVLPGVIVTWSSSATAVATVSASGLATATGHGSTTITATSGAVSGSAALDVSLTASVASVIVTPSTATLAALGATQQFTAEARDAGNNVLPGVTFTWSSSAATVATVSGAGLATATGHGSTTITATSGAVSGSAALDVSLTASVASVIVTPSTATLAALGATQQFIAEARDANGHVLPGVTFTWSSSATAVATVSGAGLATATGNGSATITAEVAGVQGSAAVTVNQAVTAIVIAPDSATLKLTPEGSASPAGMLRVPAPPPVQQFAAIAQDANGNPVNGVVFTWASSDTAVATVDNTGLATAIGRGATTISASVSGVTGTARLVVR